MDPGGGVGDLVFIIINDGHKRVFFNFKSSFISLLAAPSALFEYLCYVYTRWLEIFYSFIAGIDFRLQYLTSIDVRFWRL